MEADLIVMTRHAPGTWGPLVIATATSDSRCFIEHYHLVIVYFTLGLKYGIVKSKEDCNYLITTFTECCKAMMSISVYVVSGPLCH